MGYLSNYLPTESAEQLETKYYVDTNCFKNWELFLKAPISSQQTYQDRIEKFAALSNDTIQLFIEFVTNTFNTLHKDWFPGVDTTKLEFVRSYFLILACHASIPLRDAPRLIIDPELNAGLNDLAASFATLGAPITENTGKELIALPFLTSDISQLSLLLVQENKAALKELFLQKTQSTADFEWLSPQSSILVLKVVRIFKLLHLTFFNNIKNKHYGSFQAFLSFENGNVIYYLNFQKHEYLLAGDSTLIAGNANIGFTSFYSQDRITCKFASGQFADNYATQQAAFAAAFRLNELLENYLLIDPNLPEKMGYHPLHLTLEAPKDTSLFAENGLEQLIYFNPAFSAHISVVPALDERNRERYFMGKDPILSDEFITDLEAKMHAAGSKSNRHLSAKAFKQVKIIHLNPQDILFSENEESLFIFIAMNEGLRGFSKRNPSLAFHPKPWTPIGHIGAIQNAPRLASIVADAEVELLMIPETVYLEFWRIEYNDSELSALINNASI